MDVQVIMKTSLDEWDCPPLPPTTKNRELRKPPPHSLWIGSFRPIEISAPEFGKPIFGSVLRLGLRMRGSPKWRMAFSFSPIVTWGLVVKWALYT